MNRTVTVTASEIASWVYCPESWRLKALGHESANQVARDEGTVRHGQMDAVERVARASIAIGRILIIVALVALAALWWLNR
jgi:hypothetical protein